MTHKEYIVQFLKKSVDNDGVYWNQCVDMVHHYCKNVLGIDCPRGNAIDLWNKKWNPAYIKIENTLRNNPKQWDIIIFWPTPWNKYWHIWIVDNGNEMNVMVLEQNAWTWNWDWKGANAIRLQLYNYVQPKVLWRYRYLPEKELIDEVISKNSILWDKANDVELRKRLKEHNDYLRSLQK